MIPVSSIHFDADVEETVLAVLRSGMIAQGPMVARLEDEFAAMVGVAHTVAVNNGTTALIAALDVLDLQPGDEVITSPFTFVATLNAILQAGATARFADIRPDDFAVDPGQIDQLVNERTKVLMPVHLYGQMADMNAISEIAVREGLTIVEDAAQAHGAALEGRMAGSWGIGCFSLYATKNLTSGEGGLITTDDDKVADRLRVLRNQGMRQRYHYEMAGNNYRLTDLQAAVCVPQLKTYGEKVRRRQENAEALTAALAHVDWLQLPRQLPGREHVWHQYTVLLHDDAPIDRDEFVKHLHDSGIGSGIYYPKVVFDYDCYRLDPRVIAEEVPVATSIAARCVSLPVHPGVGPNEIETIAAAVISAAI
jgi:perosamine synthetase